MGVRIEFNSEGFRQILFSEGTRQVVSDTAETICAEANANNARGGTGFESSTIPGGYGGGRYIGFVKTTDNASMVAESEDKALTRAVHS